MSKIITNYNSKGQFHGYQELYWGGKLGYKRFYNNGIRIDYDEYSFSGKLVKRFYI